ncbi:hypothetical protein MNBD_GAMMA12-970 [hydrothermal vent metagenome]|uniref:Uncharacterized protein n=1 Tax=hydrothermal vent metagenome TaxID=652676 RepID=A0A3B0YLV7_9ZZZZ
MPTAKIRLLKYWGLLLLLCAHFTAQASSVTLPKNTEKFILAHFKFKQISHNKTIDIYGFMDGIKLKNFGNICHDENLFLKIHINTSIKNVKSMSIFLENPTLTRVAKYNFFESSLPFIVSRYKKTYSGNFIVVIETATTLYFNQNDIRSGVRYCP